uniref:Uncharacterized protein n=1 Tax=Arundo donax TaxID=35708 RepID=A0A0A8Z0Y0_ARUDO
MKCMSAVFAVNQLTNRTRRTSARKRCLILWGKDQP